MPHSPFSNSAIDKAVRDVEAQDGNTLAVGVESENGERPAIVIEAQGESERVTWAAWAKTKLTKASTAVGAKVGIRWP